MPPSCSKVAAIVAIAVALSACATSTCDTDPKSNVPVDYRAGTTSADATFYETSADDGQYLKYDAGAHYRLYHGLKGRPALTQVYVSFSSTGTNGGNEAPAAGNMAEILAVTDQYVEILNDTCAGYWLRVVAADPVVDASGGAAGAGGSP